MSCEYKDCKFSKLQNIFYKKDINNKYRCAFHLSKDIKNTFSLEEQKNYANLIKKYVYLKSLRNDKIEFDNAIFLDVNWTDILQDVKHNKIIFRNCVFIKNARFNNIKCKELYFKECRFLDGGGIKNSNIENNLDIDELELLFYELHGDFIVDIGYYATENGLETTTGRIRNIKFNNPQIGNGRIFFIGLNEKLEKADFQNRILDNVIFENCNLKNALFLNAKVDKTIFRNINFYNSKNLNYVSIKKDKKEGTLLIVISTISLPLITLSFYELLKNFNIHNLLDIAMLLSISVTFFIVGFTIFDIVYTSCLSIFKWAIDNKNTTTLNTHISTKDEESIVQQIINTNSQKNIDNIKALINLYEQLAINFLNTDKQLAGEFIYSKKYYKFLIDFSWRNPFDIFPLRINHFINGFGQRWFRALFHIIVTIFIFTYIFSNILIPNIDYVSTHNTPSFLLDLKTKTSANHAGINVTKYDFNATIWNYKEKPNNNIYRYE